MRKRELAAVMQRTEAELVASVLPPGSVRRVAGAYCLSFPEAADDYVNRALGFGTITEPAVDVLRRIARVYDRGGTTPRLSLAGDLAPRAAYRAAEQLGFREYLREDQVWAYTRRRAPGVPRVAGLTIERVGAADAERYAALMFRTFSRRGRGFRDGIARLVRSGARSGRTAAFIGRVDGVPAATGLISFIGEVGGLANATVLERFRGRGIQAALIAHRVRFGWERGYRLFFSGTANPASARNLADVGFRLLYMNRDLARE